MSGASTRSRLAFAFACASGLASRVAGAAPELETAPPPPSAVQGAQTQPPDCSPQSGRPPDPRCGDPLDGRPEAQPTTGQQLSRDALWLPRETADVLFWPFVKTSDVIEYHHLPGWMQAIFTTDDGLVGVQPELSYATGFIPTIGAHAFFRRFPGAGSQVAARFLTGGPSVILGELQLRAPSWTGLALDAGFDRRYDRLFAGLGPMTTAELNAEGRTLARYGSDILKAELRWTRRIDRRLIALLHGDIQHRDYQSDDVRGGPPVNEVFGMPADQCAAAGLIAPCVNPAFMPGFYQGLRIIHVGGAMTVDARDHARDGSGVTATVDGSFGQGIAGDPTREARLSGEIVGALGGTDRLLLLRARVSMVEALNTHPIPFDELVSPSGNLGMRGFPDGRFRGESGAVATAEYRYYIASIADAAVFTDWGTVAGPGFTGLFTNHWFPDFGIGVRFYSAAIPHWEATPEAGVQITYAPNYGLRLLLAVAAF